MQFDRGYISAYFITDTEKMEAQLDKPYILITDKKISTMKEIMGILEPVAQSGRSLLIIAEDVDGEALSALVVNKLRGTLKIAACKAPGFGDRRKEILEDIATLTGATVISTDKGMKMEDAGLEALGTAEKITLNKEGVITVEEAKGTETHVEVVEGMQFDRGYISAYFITDTEKMEAQLDKPYILITDKKVSTMKELMGVLEPVAQSGRPLLIIAEDVDGDALSALVVNKLRGALKIAACKAPGFGDRRKEMLEDIATLTGATVISADKGMKIEVDLVSILLFRLPFNLLCFLSSLKQECSLST